MVHVESKASGPSARFVQAFWQSAGEHSAGATHRVLPDACADFIFNMSDPSLPTRDCAAIVGTMTRAIVVPAQGRRDVFGVRFRPAAAWLLWRAPMRRLCDGQAPLDDVVPGASHLAERLSVLQDFRARIALAESWIETRLAHIAIDGESLRAITAINTQLESGTGGTVLATLGWNERKLQRFFEAAYGPSPRPSPRNGRQPLGARGRPRLLRPSAHGARVPAFLGPHDQRLARRVREHEYSALTVLKNISVMAGLDPATQWPARLRGRETHEKPRFHW